MIIGKVQNHLKLDQDIKPEEILNSIDTEKIDELIPVSLVHYKFHLQNVLGKLVKLNIIYRPQRFILVLIIKIERTINKIDEEGIRSLSCMSDGKVAGKKAPRSQQ